MWRKSKSKRAVPYNKYKIEYQTEIEIEIEIEIQNKRAVRALLQRLGNYNKTIVVEAHSKPQTSHSQSLIPSTPQP